MSNLRGTLDSISLLDVAQLLNANRKTGMLQVSCGRSSGVLYFSSGNVIHAETLSAQGELAAFEILEWASGQFEFLTTQVQAPVSIRRTVPDLLMDSVRLQDSRRRLNTIFPDLKVVPWPTLPAPQLFEGLKLFAEDRKIIPLFDGYRDFHDIMSTSGHHDVAVRQAASVLRDAGRLEVLDPNVSVRVVPLKVGLFRKARHLELPKALETTWAAMGPYQRGIQHLRVIWPKGPAVERVTFQLGFPNFELAVPRELMEAWGLTEGSLVNVRPAP